MAGIALGLLVLLHQFQSSPVVEATTLHDLQKTFVSSSATQLGSTEKGHSHEMLSAAYPRLEIFRPTSALFPIWLTQWHTDGVPSKSNPTKENTDKKILRGYRQETVKGGENQGRGEGSPGTVKGGYSEGRGERNTFGHDRNSRDRIDNKTGALLWLMVHHASAVYVEDRPALAAWNCSRCIIPPVIGFNLTTLIIDTQALLQAYVGVHHDKQLVVVCFRGTHSTYIKNWIDDLWALELDLNYPGVDHAYVHRGFFYAYHHTQLRPQVTAEVLRLLLANPGYTLAITGHSLGAALASLAGLDLVVSFQVPRERVRVVTFGSPRVGNPVFASFFKDTLPFSVRVTHSHDLVVHLPPHSSHEGLLSYHHVAQEIWYHRTSPFSSAEILRACDGTGEDAACSRSVSGSSVLDHLKYLGVSLCSVPGLEEGVHQQSTTDI